MWEPAGLQQPRREAMSGKRGAGWDVDPGGTVGAPGVHLAREVGEGTEGSPGQGCGQSWSGGEVGAGTGLRPKEPTV